MIRALSLKARVVLNAALAAFVFSLAAPDVSAQNILERKIAVNFNDIAFADALQEIEHDAGVHFIYSSNVVEPGRKISYTASVSLKTLFEHLGKEMNLEFKAQSNYVIVRRAAFIPSPPTLTFSPKKIEPIAGEQAAAGETVQVQARHNSNEGALSYDLAARIHREYLFRKDSMRLKKTMLEISQGTKSGRAKSKFYAAGGVFLNDFSGGVEIQAGMRSLYGVFNTSFAEGDYLRIGVGAGTNFRLFKKFSVSPVYTFASLKQIGPNGITPIVDDGYRVNAQHHQLKLMVEYPITKNFTLKAGPAFNYMKLNMTREPEILLYNNRGPARANAGSQNGPGSAVFTGGQQTTRPASAGNYEVMKSWIGFEAGLYYSLNFSKVR
jgi:hypothetical protein